MSLEWLECLDCVLEWVQCHIRSAHLKQAWVDVRKVRELCFWSILTRWQCVESIRRAPASMPVKSSKGTKDWTQGLLASPQGPSLEGTRSCLGFETKRSRPDLLVTPSSLMPLEIRKFLGWQAFASAWACSCKSRLGICPGECEFDWLLLPAAGLNDSHTTCLKCVSFPFEKNSFMKQPRCAATLWNKHDTCSSKRAGLPTSFCRLGVHRVAPRKLHPTSCHSTSPALLRARAFQFLPTSHPWYGSMSCCSPL